jgi:hypothetical protein
LALPTTAAATRCNRVSCAWRGASRGLLCTNFRGIASLPEIARLRPQLLPNEIMKLLTWGDQWICYDDPETIGRK